MKHSDAALVEIPLTLIATAARVSSSVFGLSSVGVAGASSSTISSHLQPAAHEPELQTSLLFYMDGEQE